MMFLPRMEAHTWHVSIALDSMTRTASATDSNEEPSASRGAACCKENRMLIVVVLMWRTSVGSC